MSVCSFRCCARFARRDVTLRLERQGESVLLDYTLPAGRVFYPLKELMERYGEE